MPKQIIHIRTCTNTHIHDRMHRPGHTHTWTSHFSSSSFASFSASFLVFFSSFFLSVHTIRKHMQPRTNAHTRAHTSASRIMLHNQTAGRGWVCCETIDRTKDESSNQHASHTNATVQTTTTRMDERAATIGLARRLRLRSVPLEQLQIHGPLRAPRCPQTQCG